MKKINEYKAFILDMDGTLYFQTLLRINMALELLYYYLLHPLKIKDLFILKYYRKIREKKEAYLSRDFINEQYRIVGDRFNTSEEYVKKIVEIWIYDRPLKYIKRFKDDYLINLMNSLKKDGAKIIIYSDYPVESKVKVLKIQCDYMFSANDKDISCLKPNTKGLEFILKSTNLIKDEILFIGDRYEKDGKCAENCGIDFLILSPKKSKRIKQIRGI